MAGILDNKHRVLDVVLTDIGRDQMNRGEFEISYVSFSDKGTEYTEQALPIRTSPTTIPPTQDFQDSLTGVLSSIKERLFLEAYSSPTDEIVPEINNVGDLILTKQISPTLTVNNGVLYEKIATGYQQVDAFSRVDKYTRLTSGRFAGLRLLETSHDIADFEVSSESIELNIRDKNLPNNVDALNPILVDQRFTGNLNTLFLPPTVEANGVSTPMRAYNRFGKEHTITNCIDEVKNKSWATKRVALGDDNTYENYNLLGQVYIKKDQTVKKLLVVDAGEFVDGDNVPILQVYHLGFVYKDENGTSKFTRSFSLLFHNGDIQ